MIWLKKFRRKKMQSIIILLMITVSSLLMISSLQIITSMSKPYKKLVEETNPPCMRAYPDITLDKSSEEWIAELSAIDHVNKVVEVKRHSHNGKLYNKGIGVEKFISFTAYDDEVYGHVRKIDGDFSSLKEGECFIPSILTYEEGLKVGDFISIYDEETEIIYKIKGVFVDTYSLNSAYMMDILVRDVSNFSNQNSYYAIYAEAGINGEEIEREYLKQKNGKSDVTSSTISVVIANAQLTENILGAILLSLSSIIFIVCTIMIRYIIRNALINDKQSIAIYKTIGYTSTMIESIYLKFYILFILLGCILGAVLSPIVSNSFIKKAFECLNIRNTFNFTPILICSSFILMVALLQILLELRKLKVMKPVQIITGTDTLGTKKRYQLKKTRNINFSSFHMSLRMLARDRKNTIIIIITCFLSVYMVNMSLACFSNMNAMKEKNYYWMGFDHHDVSISYNGNEEKLFKIGDELEQLEEVEKIIYWTDNLSLIVKNEGNIAVMAYETFEGIEVPILEGRNPIYKNEVAIGSAYADEIDKKIGDYLDVYISENVCESLLIVGTYQGFYNLGRGIKILGSLLQDELEVFHYENASIYLKEGVNKKEFVQKYSNQYKNLSTFCVREEKFETIIDMICEPQKTALAPFMVLVVVVGGLNIFYIIYFKNMTESKKQCIYNSIGYSKKHLFLANFNYVFFIAGASMIITIPCFLVTFPRIMLVAMSLFGFKEYPVSYNVESMIFGNLIIMAVFMLCTVVSSFNMKKNNVNELVTE